MIPTAFEIDLLGVMALPSPLAGKVSRRSRDGWREIRLWRDSPATPIRPFARAKGHLPRKGEGKRRSTVKALGMTHPEYIHHPVGHIILRLARTKDFPEGTLRRGYDVRAVLDAAGHLSVDTWRHHRTAYSVQRFWDNEPVRQGSLVHRAGRAGGSTGAVRYAGLNEEDEDGFRLGEHVLQVDEFVSIRDDAGEMQTFRVSDMKPTGEALK
jgi:hypothetical protein